MAIRDLLQQTAATAPDWDAAEYDAGFQALERAATPGEERQAGAEILAAQEPDWRDVQKKAEAVLERLPDLRAALYYTHAATETQGFPGLAEATGYVRSALEDYWETCLPPLDPDDPDDPAGFRVNALRGLAHGATVLRAVWRAPVTASNAFGRVTMSDIAVSEGEREAPPGETVIADAATITAAFRDTAPDTLTAIALAARQALEDLQAIDRVFDEKVPGQGPDLSDLTKLLRKAAARLADEAGLDAAPADVAAEEPGEASAVPSAGPAAAAPLGAITSQADVQKTLDRLLEYYRKHEPSSPLPILLQRAKRLVGADFVTILKDMAPLGVENVYLIGGIEEVEE